MNVEDAIRAVAAAGPAYAGDLGSIQRRGRRHARRRTAAKAGAAVAGVSALAFFVPHGSASPIAAPSATASSSEASPSAVSPAPASSLRPWTSGQRLVLGGLAEWGLSRTPRVTIETGMTYSSVMLPNGQIASHRFGVNGQDSIDDFVPLPDGRFVVLRVLSSGSSGVDSQMRLQVLDGREKVVLSHDAGQNVRLLAATGEAAYLLRPHGLVRHDLATGRERMMVSTAVLGRDLSGGGADLRMSLEGDRLAMIRGDSGPQAVDVFDLRTGQRIASYGLGGLDATFAGPLRLSPDGRHLAIFYRTRADSRLAVVDVPTQTLTFDQPLSQPDDPFADMQRSDSDERIRGVAWSDDRTLRIAWAQLPPNPSGTYTFNQLTRMRTIVLG